jgi:hypothetical protein
VKEGENRLKLAMYLYRGTEQIAVFVTLWTGFFLIHLLFCKLQWCIQQNCVAM